MQAISLYSDEELGKRQLPRFVANWRQAKCVQAIEKYRDTFWKLVRAADHLSDAISVVRKDRHSRDPEGSARFASALEDIPLYLDMLWVYLRVQADVFATIASYTYEEQGTIPDESFRSHRKWFLHTRPEYDDAYTRILSSFTGWFDELAGEQPKGIRDVIIHQRGTYQLGWTVPPDDSAFRIEASLIRDSKLIHNDVIKILRRVLHGYFAFLDSFVEHALHRLGTVLAPPPDGSTRLYRPYFSYDLGNFPSEWLFPQI